MYHTTDYSSVPHYRIQCTPLQNAVYPTTEYSVPLYHTTGYSVPHYRIQSTTLDVQHYRIQCTTLDIPHYRIQCTTLDVPHYRIQCTTLTNSPTFKPQLSGKQFLISTKIECKVWNTAKPTPTQPTSLGYAELGTVQPEHVFNFFPLWQKQEVTSIWPHPSFQFKA